MNELTKLEEISTRLAAAQIASGKHVTLSSENLATQAVADALAIFVECAKVEATCKESLTVQCSLCDGKGTLDNGDPGAADGPCFKCQPDSGGWIPHDPSGPVPERVSMVRFKDGFTAPGKRGDEWLVSQWDHTNPNPAFHIVDYLI